MGRIGAQWDLSDKLREKPATHLGSWLRTPEVEKVAISDADPNRASEVLGAWTDLPKNELILAAEPLVFYEDMAFDIVSVATPAGTHKEVVGKLLKNNPPRLIFCEKPLATTEKDAKWMVDACAAEKVKLAVNHTRRWDPLWQFMSKHVLSNVSQTPSMAVAHFSGDLMNVGIHMADLINWFKLGDCCEVFGHRDVDYLLFELDVFFQRKRLRMVDNGQTLEVFHSKPSHRYDNIKDLQSLADPFQDAIGDDEMSLTIPTPRTEGEPVKTPMLEACEQLAKCAISDTIPLCTGEDGLLALERTLSWERKAA